ARGRLKGKKIRLQASGGAVLVASGSHVGWASMVSPGVYRVRDMAPRGFRVLARSSLEEAAQANRAYVERLAAEARAFIEREARGRRVYVAVSGGIDSSVAATLTVEALGPDRVTLVYADTGMEWPESRRVVERLASRLGARLDVVTPRRDPLEIIGERGLMGRDNRWCTRLLKLEPLREYYRRARDPLIVEGVRAYESTARARQARRGVNPALGVERILPILHWTRLEVQLYAILRGVEASPLYEQGLVRIGCIACPAMTLHELRLARSLQPSFYHRLAEAVARACGISVEEALEWIMEGGWRRLGGCPRGGASVA
ncbi:MAG: phosphoadenosine phosphosulfate reductase family protein, partial [Desulfurococcales archaeon]|nr:phosphoadenosine phosphosulfate reductase family protein [Desulfurococcales archaeon]